VPFQRALQVSGDYTPGAGAVCLRSCDPCAPACAGGESCFASSGRGFCAPLLLPEGAACEPGLEPASQASPGPCAGQLTCAELDQNSGWNCLRYCRPEQTDAGTGASYSDRSASPSVDCPAGTLCVETYAGSEAAEAGEFVCVQGALVDGGATCGAAAYCRAPARCEAGSCVEP